MAPAARQRDRAITYRGARRRGRQALHVRRAQYLAPKKATGRRAGTESALRYAYKLRPGGWRPTVATKLSEYTGLYWVALSNDYTGVVGTSSSEYVRTYVYMYTYLNLVVQEAYVAERLVQDGSRVGLQRQR
jgi:hypothetical protein